MNSTKHVVLLTSNIFGRGFDSRRLHHYKPMIVDHEWIKIHLIWKSMCLLQRGGSTRVIG